MWLKGLAAETGQRAPSALVAEKIEKTGLVDSGQERSDLNKKESRKLDAQARKGLAARRRPLQKQIEESEMRLAEIADRREE